jgi:beta-N-acetylhexosaminidase
MERLKQKPFYLSDEQIRWVTNTIAKMSTEDKIRQLFCPIVFTKDEEELRELAKNKKPGGILFREGQAGDIRRAHEVLQSSSDIPLLTASNLERGGIGSAVEGTYYGSPMLVAATNNNVHGYQLGKVACSEGKAVGANWAFAPIVDIDMNFRNPITNVRTFGSDPKRIIEFARGYNQAAKEEEVATAIKHFPGDGVDERDQHLLTSVNSLSKEAWDDSYGKIYQELIDDGALTLMAGHIALPAYEEEKKNTPATLSKTLLQGLLRGQLGFNGLIVTDATPMVGFTSAMARHQAVPWSIEAGCDMFLFNKNYDEDYQYMLQGYQKGILSEARLEEAVLRILGTKAALNLHIKQQEKTLVPSEDALSTLNNNQNAKWAKECADEGVTLVKDSQQLLPISPKATPRVLLQILGDFSSNARVEAFFKDALEGEGFQVTCYEKEDFSSLVSEVEVFKATYDLVIYIGNVETVSNKTVSRLDWYTFFGQGNNIPWFVKEVPTMFISVGNPYHMFDAPMIPTFINGYCNSKYVMETIVEKIMGRSEFKGLNPFQHSMMDVIIKEN